MTELCACCARPLTAADPGTAACRACLEELAHFTRGGAAARERLEAHRDRWATLRLLQFVAWGGDTRELDIRGALRVLRDQPASLDSVLTWAGLTHGALVRAQVRWEAMTRPAPPPSDT